MYTLHREAYKRPLFFTDGLEFARTVPLGESYIGYIKTTKGEAKVSRSSMVLCETLLSGAVEIAEQEYWNEIMPVEKRVPCVF